VTAANSFAEFIRRIHFPPGNGMAALAAKVANAGVIVTEIPHARTEMAVEAAGAVAMVKAGFGTREKRNKTGGSNVPQRALFNRLDGVDLLGR
jgi:hypothetical protein